jgi:hypothetical protein
VNRTAFAVALVTLVAGCAMSGSHGRIRQIEGDAAARCKFLGSVEDTERSGWDMSDDQLGGASQIRRKVSAMGGNAFVLTHGKPSGFGPTIQADVYRCP